MYCDSAIFIKLLCVEPDSAFFERALRGHALRSSELARAEVFTALMAKERNGHISARDRERAWSLFSEWLKNEMVVLEPLESRVIDRAMHTVSRCHPRVPVRTLDAIHVASCDLSNDFPLVATDIRLRAAASQIGVPLFPEQLPNDIF